MKVAALAIYFCFADGACAWEAWPATSAVECRVKYHLQLVDLTAFGAVVFDSRCEDKRGDIIEGNWRDPPPKGHRGR